MSCSQLRDTSNVELPTPRTLDQLALNSSNGDLNYALNFIKHADLARQHANF